MMSISQALSSPKSVSEMPAAMRQQIVAICYMIAAASIFVCSCWLLQTLSFAGSDAKAATVVWTLLAAGVAGLGSGLLFAARCWFAIR